LLNVYFGSPEMSKSIFSKRKRKEKEQANIRNKKVLDSRATKIRINQKMDFVLCLGFLYAVMKSTILQMNPPRVMYKQERYPISKRKK
jgi:hypothetical protein